MGDAARGVGEAAWEGVSCERAATAFRNLTACLEDGLGVIEDGRLGDLMHVVREEGLEAGAKGALGGAVGAYVPAGPFGEADALLLPVGPDAARRFDEEEKSLMLLDVDGNKNP